MSSVKLFIGTPVRDQRVHVQYMMGLLQVAKEFGDNCSISMHMGAFLPMARDALTAMFLQSPCTHMLCVDSDVSWQPKDVHMLLDSGKDVISGCYVKRMDKPEIPARLTGRREGENGELWEAEYVPAGFMLIAKPVIERMSGANQHIQYRTPDGLRTALWAQLFGSASYGGVSSYSGEDVAFCERWRALPGNTGVWLHEGVQLPHIGEHTFMPIKPTGQNPAIPGQKT